MLADTDDAVARIKRGSKTARQLPQRQQFRPGNMMALVFPGLAHIHQTDRIAALNGSLHFFRGNFTNVRLSHGGDCTLKKPGRNTDNDGERTQIPLLKGNTHAMTANQTAIQIQNFSKEYPMPRQKEKRVAVDSLTLDVPTGGLFGFLGPNGAGKTTTIKMLLGFIAPTAGEAWLFGRPVSEVSARQTVGYLPEQPYFPKFLSALEVVQAHAGLSGLSGKRAKSQIEACLRQVGMWDNRHMILSKCSKGMTQRVGLASALVGDPQLLIMDEPSSGLDPVGRKELRELLVTLKNEGKTIFLSSHLLSEMESVCDRVAVMAHGRLVACGTPQEITQASSDVRVQIEQAQNGQGYDEVLAQQVEDWGGAVESSVSGTCLRVPAAVVYKVMGLLESRRARLVAVSPQRETLEDAFLRLVGG
jgi:ABC-2 type transport system ATP-binding protein